jgi:F5/8 type C domain
VRWRDAARWLRRALVGVLALAVAWSLYGVFGRKNLARNAAVITTSAEARVRANPRALVDGDRKNLGFHTQKGRDQAATIDLGTIRTIRSVEIYNRFDCCQTRALPLLVEVSTDGAAFEAIARRTETFTLWKVSLAAKPVRFLRLTDEGNNFFHLAEVEVY